MNLNVELPPPLKCTYCYRNCVYRFFINTDVDSQGYMHPACIMQNLESLDITISKKRRLFLQLNKVGFTGINESDNRPHLNNGSRLTFSIFKMCRLCRKECCIIMECQHLYHEDCVKDFMPRMRTCSQECMNSWIPTCLYEVYQIAIPYKFIFENSAHHLNMCIDSLIKHDANVARLVE